MGRNVYQDFASGIGRLVDQYYPEFLDPATQFLFDTAVIGGVTKATTHATAYLVKDEKTANVLIASEFVLSGMAEIMAYYRYCSAVSAKKQKPKTDKYQNAQDADYREV